MDNIIKSDYFYERCIWAIAYCDNPKQNIDYLFNNLGIDKAKAYDVLNSFLAINYYALDDTARENLNYLVNYFKFIFPKNDFCLLDGRGSKL